MRFRCLPVILGMCAISRIAAAHEVTPPRPKSEPVGAWPSGNAEAHDVVVPVIVVVAADGTVQEATIEASVSGALDTAALTAARAFTYEPATQDGQPVSAKIRAIVRFKGATVDAPKGSTSDSSRSTMSPPATAS